MTKVQLVFFSPVLLEVTQEIIGSRKCLMFFVYKTFCEQEKGAGQCVLLNLVSGTTVKWCLYTFIFCETPFLHIKLCRKHISCKQFTCVLNLNLIIFFNLLQIAASYGNAVCIFEPLGINSHKRNCVSIYYSIYIWVATVVYSYVRLLFGIFLSASPSLQSNSWGAWFSQKVGAKLSFPGCHFP